MAQARVVKEYNFYVKGLVTEASPLTFPPNSSLDEDNFDLLRDGSRRRRLGIDYEQDYALTDTGLPKEVFEGQNMASGIWDNVNNDPLLSILVVQIGTNLWFFDAYADAISATPLNGGNPINIAGDSSSTFTGTSIFGKLVLVNGQKGFFVLSYDKDTDVVNINSRIVLVRDIWGIEDGLAVNTRPPDLGKEHEYNLINQGWGGDNRDASVAYYSTFKIVEGIYPSNADLVWIGKDGGNSDVFNSKLITRHFKGTTPAAKGTFTIELFRRGSSRQAALDSKVFSHNSSDISGNPFDLSKFVDIPPTSFPVLDGDDLNISSISSPLFYPILNPDSEIPQDETNSGLSSVTSFAGRVWFSGSSSELISGDRRSPNLGGYVLFSQIVDNDQKMGLCHQEGDPTDEDLPDVLDTDGGSIQIPEASTIVRLVPISNGVVVFAENGVWEISGGDSPFSATNFQVRKVTAAGAASPASVVQVDSNIFFWSKAGILVLAPDQITGFLVATNISETTIQTFLNEINVSSASLSRGIYDVAARKIRWLYNGDTDFDGITDIRHYNRELIFDTVLSAFYTTTYGAVETDSPYLMSSFKTPEFNVLTIDDPIVVAEAQVTVGGEDVSIHTDVRGNGISRLAYLAIKPDNTYKFTVALQRDPEFIDWISDDAVGVDAAAFLLTGFEILEDTQRNKQASYITCNFKRTETGFEVDQEGNLQAINPSSCLIQAQWDYANSPLSGKFGPTWQAYRLRRQYTPTGPADLFEYGQSVITTKSKLRGRGKALSLLFSTEPKKDLHLYGWGINFTGVTDV